MVTVALVCRGVPLSYGDSLLPCGGGPLPFGDVRVLPCDSFAKPVLDLAFFVYSPAICGKGFAQFGDVSSRSGDASSRLDDALEGFGNGFAELDDSSVPQPFQSQNGGSALCVLAVPPWLHVSRWSALLLAVQVKQRKPLIYSYSRSLQTRTRIHVP